MKKKFFMACTALVMSAAAMVGVKAYNRSQMSDLALANIEALSRGETPGKVEGACGNQYGVPCSIECPNPKCHSIWSNPHSLTGPVVRLVGTCSCGHEIDYTK